MAGDTGGLGATAPGAAGAASSSPPGTARGPPPGTVASTARAAAPVSGPAALRTAPAAPVRGGGAYASPWEGAPKRGGVSRACGNRGDADRPCHAAGSLQEPSLAVCEGDRCPPSGGRGARRRAGGQYGQGAALTGRFAPAALTFREEQCAAYNHRTDLFKNFPGPMDWAPRYVGVDPREQCKLTCQARALGYYYVLEPRVRAPSRWHPCRRSQGGARPAPGVGAGAPDSA